MAGKVKISSKGDGRDSSSQFGYQGNNRSAFGYDPFLYNYGDDVAIAEEETKAVDEDRTITEIAPAQPFEMSARESFADIEDAKELNEPAPAKSSPEDLKSDNEYKSFMSDELSVATDKHDIKAEQDSDGKHVLGPEKDKQASEQKDQSPVSQPQSKDTGNKLEKDTKQKDKSEEKDNATPAAPVSENLNAELPTATQPTNEAKDAAMPDIPRQDNASQVLEQNRKPVSESEEKANPSDADIQADARKQIFQNQVAAVREALQSQLAEQKSELSNVYAAQRQVITGDAAVQRGAVIAKINAAKSKTRASYNATEAKLSAKLAADIEQVNTIKQTKLTALSEAVLNKKTEFANYIKIKEAEPEQFAKSEGARIKSELTEAANLCLSQSSGVASRHSKEEAKEAALKVGSESAKDIREKIQPMQENILELASELKGNFGEYKIKVEEELDKAESELKPVIEKLATDTIQKLTSDHNLLVAKLKTSQTQELNSLDHLQSSTISALKKLENDSLSGLEKLYHQGDSALDQMGASLNSGVNNLESDTLQSLNGPGKPYLPGVTALLDDANSRLQQIHVTGFTVFKQQNTVTSEGLNTTAVSFTNNAAAKATSASESIAKLLEQQHTQLSETFTSFSKNADKSVQNFEKESQVTIDNGLKEIESGIDKVKEKIEAQNTEAKEKITAKTTENIDKAKAPLYDDNQTRSDEAAKEASKDSWWDVVKGALAAIATIALMFVVVILVAALIVAALAAIGLTVGLWTVVAVIGIGFLAYAAYKSYEVRSKQMDEGKLPGWALIPMILSDAVGVSDIYAGIKNKDLGTQEDLHLSAYERSEKFTTGAFTLVMTVVGVRGGVKGLRTTMVSEGGFMGALKGFGSGLKEVPGKIKMPTSLDGALSAMKGSLIESGGEISKVASGMWKGTKEFFGAKGEPVTKGSVNIEGETTSNNPPKGQKESTNTEIKDNSVEPSSQEETTNQSTQEEIKNQSNQEETTNQSTQEEVTNQSTQEETTNQSTQEEIKNQSTQEETTNQSTQEEVTNQSTQEETTNQNTQEEIKQEVGQSSPPKVVEDGFGGYKATWEGDNKAFSMFKPEEGGVNVSDIFRGNQPKGSAGQMLADSLTAAGLEQPSSVKISNILEDQPTLKQLADGVPIEDTVLGKTLKNTVEKLGGKVIEWRTGEYRGKTWIEGVIEYPQVQSELPTNPFNELPKDVTTEQLPVEQPINEDIKNQSFNEEPTNQSTQEEVTNQSTQEDIKNQSTQEEPTNQSQEETTNQSTKEESVNETPKPKEKPTNPIPKSWDKFEPQFNEEFRAKLNEFRGNEDLTPDPGLRGGEGQLFRGKNPFSALKRWFKSRINDMPESIRLLKDAKSAVNENPNLIKDIEVIEIEKTGSDSALRDFDPDSIPLRDAISDPDVAAAKQRLINELEGTGDPVLRNILGKLKRNSANVHWSPAKQKILIIDMQ